jgi:potassium-dependent mechanosensitive channel
MMKPTTKGKAQRVSSRGNSMLRVLLPQVLALLLAATAWGQVEAPGVTIVQVDAAIERVSASLAADDPRRVALLNLYRETRAALDSFQQYQQSLKTYSEARANASQEVQSILAALASARDAPGEDTAALATATLQELEQRTQLDRAELDAQKARLADLTAGIDGMAARAAEIRKKLTELTGRQEELVSSLKLMNTSVEEGGEDEARLWLAQAQVASMTAEKASLNEELLSQPMRLDLLKAQRDQTSDQIAVLERGLRVMEQRAGELRQIEASRAQADAQMTAASTLGKHPLVQQLADENAGLTASFSQRSAAIEDVRRRETSIRDKADRLESDLKSIERKLEILGMNKALGQILREQKAQLPAGRESKKAIAETNKNITVSSMRQIDFEEEARQLRNAPEYVARLVAGQSPVVVAQVNDDLLELARNRRDLLAQAVDLENTYARALGDLEFTLHRYAGVVDHYNDFIEEHLLWMPSREMFSLFQGGAVVTQMGEVFDPARWGVVIRALPGELWQQPLTALALILVLLLFYLTPRLIARLVATGKDVGYVRSDLFSNTLRALGLCLLLSLRWPGLLLTLAWLFEMQEAESELATALYIASMRMALYAWGLGFLRMVLLPKGLVARHFRWPTRRTESLYRRVVRLEQTFLPATFLTVLSVSLYPREVGGALAALGVIILLLSMAQFFRRVPHFAQGKMELMLTDSFTGTTSSFARFTRLLLIVVPLFGTVAVLLGYTYTAVEFALLLIKTVVLYCLVVLVHELGLRWLRLARRRMVVKAREGASQATGEASEASLEEELLENDPELLSDQGTKLLNVLTLFGGLLGLAAIWSKVLPALGVFNSFELWHYTGVVDGQEALVPLTLGNLIIALMIAFVGWVALRRIPALLEILLRQNMAVRPATAYAVTRVFQYAGTTLLVIMVLGSLGGSWSQIQWAVAALSVGIGFGLQEIVANFISGLIILFEQPIRLGDTVTVGDVSGKVTKIRIRATTIRDFDRRELLVPNKEFITNQLLNWSLSDQITRWVLEVGVAYGSDMDTAMAIIRDVAYQHPLVLNEPESQVTFDEFGDSSLLIKLRFFMDQLDMRLQVASEIRLEINRRLADAGIVVAFPQRDVHIDTSQPLEIRMADRPS